jgi:hypothetical protein
MAKFLLLTTQRCCTDLITRDIIVDDPTSAITTGNTYYIEGSRIKACYTVLSFVKSEGPANATFSDTYTSCEECLSGISDSVIVRTCGEFPETYAININTFTTLPTIGDIVFLTATSPESRPINGCFTISCYGIQREGTPLYSLTSIGSSYTGCTECILNNFTTYEVSTCDGTSTYYIGFPPGFDYTGYLVSFQDSFGDVFCGTVIGLGGEVTTATLISVLGTIREVSCEQCLSANTQTRIITNCLTGDEQVVYSSLFFGGNEVSNLSTDDGCFEVGDVTTSAATITTYLNYDPQPDCQECIQCTGLYYTYSSCTNTGPISEYTYDAGALLTDGSYGPFTGTTNGNGFGASFTFEISGGVIITTGLDGGVGYQIGDLFYIENPPFTTDNPFVLEVTNIRTVGIVFSYQYVQNPIGKTFYVPQLNDCVQITSFSNLEEGANYNVLSFDVFESCSECEVAADNYYIWVGSECLTGNPTIIISSDNNFTTGDYVKSLRGDMEFQCQQLISPYIYDGLNYTVFKTNTIDGFDDCETCNSGTLIGASIAKCGGGGQQFVNIPIDIWNNMAYFDSQSIFVLESYGQCYGLLNTCPLEPNFTTINPVETYYNCVECLNNNTRFPRSGGTESLICVICCDCGSTGSTITQVAPPHPVWTDGYGTEVTQMNMVTLGGNGLNN